ncbi:MAG: ABC transporter permease [Anaerolineae bacterium]|jgi:ABC-2 type transport system permease protein|nr:ABC transporter permease [Anaerolineae bacterium]
MASITSTRTLSAAGSQRAAIRKMPYLHQVSMMTWRAVRLTLRNPAEIIPGIIISIFFLVIYQDTLGNASGFLPGLAGRSYLGFILPLSVVSTALSGASLAGQAIVRDIDNGYFDKLSLTPISRSALILGPMIAGALLLVLQTSLVVALGVVMGLRPETGPLGILVMLGYALLIGGAFSGLTVGVALMTGSPGATAGSSFLFFPLSFLTATFVPLNLLSGWIQTAATYNPITYVLEAMRGLMLQGWDAEQLIRGVLSCAVMAAITYSFAFYGLRVRSRRK